MKVLKRQRGYILPVVTFISAALIILASSFLKAVESRVLSRIEHNPLQNHLTISGLRHSAIYLLTTRGQNLAGIEGNYRPSDQAQSAFIKPVIAITGREIKNDDTVYQGENSGFISIQSVNALLILKQNNQNMNKLLLRYGYSFSEAATFMDILKDYVDADSLLSLSGAEINEYNKAGLAPPRNLDMRSSWEIYNLLNRFPEEQLKKIARLSSPVGGFVNLNMSPFDIIAAIPGIEFADAVKLIEGRPYESLVDASTHIGKIIPIEAIGATTASGTYYRLTIWPEFTSHAQEVYVKLTPSADEPYEIAYQIPINLSIEEHNNFLQKNNNDNTKFSDFPTLQIAY